MTFLPAEITGRWLYPYLILDVFSRKIVGFEVHGSDDADHAAHLPKRTALAEGIHAMTSKPVPARRQRLDAHRASDELIHEFLGDRRQLGRRSLLAWHTRSCWSSYASHTKFLTGSRA